MCVSAARARVHVRILRSWFFFVPPAVIDTLLFFVCKCSLLLELSPAARSADRNFYYKALLPSRSAALSREISHFQLRSLTSIDTIGYTFGLISWQS